MTSETSRTAIITGASRGLGRALAQALAQRRWNLILDARGEETLQQARADLVGEGQVIAIPGDVNDAGHRADLAAEARRLGGIDALVNNASTLGPTPLPALLDYPLDALEEVYRINVFAPLALLQELRNQFKTDARIVNVTSDAAVEAYPTWGGYGSSKAALEQLSNVLAAEIPYRVYWVDPGDMRTQMQQDAFPGEDISDRPLPEASVPGLLTLLEANLPSGRYLARSIPSEVPV